MTYARLDRNFRLRTRPGDGIYEVVWNDPTTGKQRRKSTGTRDEAAALRALEQVAAEGRITKPKAGVTVEELIDRFHDAFERSRAGLVTSLVAMRATLAPLRQHLGALRWDQITQDVVNDYAAWRMAQPAWAGHKHKGNPTGRTVGPSTTNKDLRMLRAILNAAHANRDIPQRVEFKINVSASPPREEWLTKAEVSRMLDRCNNGEVLRDENGFAIESASDREYLYAFILISVASGARKEAVLSLTWDRVHLPDDASSLSPGDTVVDWGKGGFSKPAYIDFGLGQGNKRRPKMPVGQNPRLMAYLLFGGDRSQPFVVNRRGKRLADLKKGFATLLAECDIKKRITPHSLKHTAITWMVQDGVPLKVIAHLTNTSEATLERVYAHHRPDYAAALGKSLSVP